MKPKNKKVLNIISNVIFVIVMIILVFFMIYGFGSIANNKVPSFFGQSYVRVSSGSMSQPVYSDPNDPESELISEGFETNQIVMIQRVNVKEIEIGDVIAHYISSGIQIPSFIGTEEECLDFTTGEKSFDTKIRFHQVVNILYGTDGYIYYQTKGTDNDYVDGGYTRSDYVVGVYKESALAGVIQFISSPAGIIVLVVVPSCIVLFTLLMSIIDTIDKMIKKKKAEEAFQDAIIKSVNDSNVSVNTKKPQPSSSLGGLTESSMADFEREMAKIEKEKASNSTSNQNAVSSSGEAKEYKKPIIQQAPPAEPSITRQTTEVKTAETKEVKPTEVKTASSSQSEALSKQAQASFAKPSTATGTAKTTATATKPATAKTTSSATKPSTATKTAKTVAKPTVASTKPAVEKATEKSTVAKSSNTTSKTVATKPSDKTTKASSTKTSQTKDSTNK